LIETAIQHIVV